MKQGSFARDGLCCPVRRHYYDPLRLPLGCLTISRRPVIGGRTPHPHRRGPRRASPVATTTFFTFHVPCAGGFFDVCSKTQDIFHGLRPKGTGSAPSCLLSQVKLTTLQTSLDVADWPNSSTPLRRWHFDQRRGFHYRGPWRLPGPDLHRLVIVSLSLGYVMSYSFVLTAPELLDALPNISR